jgi:ClpP class serine protease
MSNKQNKILRYTEMVYKRPHLISQDAFSIISTYLDARNAGQLVKPEMVIAVEANEDSIKYDSKSKLGVIEIKGALTNQPVVTMCGEVGTSYESILAQAAEMVDAGVKTIILDVDSGGGEAYSCFSAANEFRKMCDENDVHVYAYVDGTAASAAYAWTCVADEVVAHPDADVGSIGVLIALMNNSKHLEQEGYTRTFISAGKEKIPFDKDGQFKDTFLADLQYKVDALYENFVSHVANYTGLSVEAIKATEAKTFMAKDALELGLVNQIMNKFEFMDFIANRQKEQINAGRT